MAQQTNVRLKLLIDTKSERVLYGEANKDFIDFLFNLLSLPLGAVINLLNKEQMVGCLGNLYKSVENLSDQYFHHPNQTKNSLLKPQISLNCSSKSLLPYIIDTPSTTQSTYSSSTTSSTYNNSSSEFGSNLNSSASPFGYSSPFDSNVKSSPLLGSSVKLSPSYNSYSSSSYSDIFFSSSSTPLVGFSSTFCLSSPSGGLIPSSTTSGFSFGSSPSASTTTSTSRTQASSTCVDGEKVGFVKSLATYIVMDDLSVKHISEFSIATLLKEFSIKDVDSLEEKLITLNVHEGVELLKASLQSKMVLTDVFLKRERLIINNNDDNDYEYNRNDSNDNEDDRSDNVLL